MATKETWQVGELARRTGLTVRTLHHWDAIGLLCPSRRTAAGYRLYDAGDVARLQAIVSLRQLGLSLDEIGATLARPATSLAGVLELQIDRLREGIRASERLVRTLEAVARTLESAEAVSVEELITSIEATTMFEKYYTQEQLAQLAERAQQVGEARVREVEAEWPALIAEVQAAMQADKDPASPEVQALAARWQALVAEFTGGDPGIAESLRRVYASEPSVRERAGIDPGLYEYVGRALRGSS